MPGDALPIDDVLPQLGEALAAGPFAVLVAAPGAGKTTRVPLALLEAPWRGDGRIVMLEPRRLAARAAARHMAASLKEEPGQTIGYRVRFDSKVSAATRVEVVTEGVFTRMILDDPELKGVAAVIFDEFHERSLEGDLGLALALDATTIRPDLRLIVMSATMDAMATARLMKGARIVTSQGRIYPVETRYLPPPAGARLEDHVATAVQQALREEPGSVLVFLPGQAEIRRTAERLSGKLPPDVDIAPLYGKLEAAEQDRAISPAPAGRRKVVLATSIAETSLTIEGVRVVIDSGWSRQPAYEPSTGLSTLETRRVSLAAAAQRRGRAGRTGPGVVYRLWAAAQGGALQPFDRPEILDADLTGLALDLAGWGVTDPGRLAFLDPPPAAAWREAVALLTALGAIDAEGRLTEEGRSLARLPLHPRLAHMIHRAAAEDQAVVAAELAVLLTERGLGGESGNLDQRLANFWRERGPRAEEARGLARRWAKVVGGTTRNSDEAGTVGRHLARAYPDRVAQAAGAPGRFRLANGRAATLDPTDELARTPFLVVADISGDAGNSRIRAAAALDAADLEDIFADAIVSEDVVNFDAGSQSVRARRVRRLGELRLADAPIAITDPAQAAAALAASLGPAEVAALPWRREQVALRDRSSYLHRAIGEPWLDLSDEAFAANAADWLGPHLMGRTALSEVNAEDLEGVLSALLPWAQRQELDEVLPSHFDAPSGERHRIDYGGENGPTLAIRVQELFGYDRHPTVAGGRVPLLLVLLSPANRPIQRTRDLPGFWRGSWRDVARELKGRYPRHPWPEDPVAAPATNRAKPRGPTAPATPPQPAAAKPGAPRPESPRVQNGTGYGASPPRRPSGARS